MIKKIISLLKSKTNHHKNSISCQDSECNKDIKIDDYLYKQIFSGKTALFAGAGISTETKFVYPISFYEQVANELNLLDEGLSFPELMERYVNQTDGRFRLIQLIQERFDHLNSFRFTRWASTRFHEELATLYPIKTIITTNWDLYFEECCRAIPYVHEQDMSFWDSSKRNVLKIHGSINSYGSIIATSSDYKKAEDILNGGGLLGSKLKTILAEKNIIFIGYSFSDADFQEIYKLVKSSLGDFHKKSYVVTPFEKEASRFEELGFEAIIADGTYFIQAIKDKAVQDDMLLDDGIYEDIEELIHVASDAHMNISDYISMKDFPHVIQTLAYQDGMLDGLGRAKDYKGTGEYSDPDCINNVCAGYDQSLEMRVEKGGRNDADAILDIAYIEGYRHALLYIIIKEDERPTKYPPLFYLYGVDEIDSIRVFKKNLRKYPKKFSREYREICKYVSSIPEGRDYHHRPTLFNSGIT